jgi:hypothetical protein
VTCFLWMVQRTSVPLQFHPPATPSSSSKETSMMSLAVRRKSAHFRWAHPLAPGQTPLIRLIEGLIFDREVLRAPVHQPSSQQCHPRADLFSTHRRAWAQSTIVTPKQCYYSCLCRGRKEWLANLSCPSETKVLNLNARPSRLDTPCVI